MSAKTSLWIIFLVNLFASLGSLYYGYFGDPIANLITGDLFNSENAFAACDLCWYMRIFQYPLTIISAIALRRKDYHSVSYIRPLALIGLVVSVYKYGLEMGFIADQGLCSPNSAASCSSSPVMYFGFITLAFLGVVSLALTLILSHSIKKKISSPLV